MRRSVRLVLLASLLLVLACKQNEPAVPGQPSEEKTDPRALKPGDYVAESSSHLGQASVGGEWSYDIPFWMREGFSVIVADVGWNGRKEAGPAFVIITRHPLPKTLDDAGLSQGGQSRVDDKEHPDDKMRLTGDLGNCRTNVGYRFVVRKKDLGETFTLFVGNRNEAEKKYDLADGRLFLVDTTVSPPRVQQVKADLKGVAPSKEPCVKLLGGLAPKSEVAKSILGELRRR